MEAFDTQISDYGTNTAKIFQCHIKKLHQAAFRCNTALKHQQHRPSTRVPLATGRVWLGLLAFH